MQRAFAPVASLSLACGPVANSAILAPRKRGGFNTLFPFGERPVEARLAAIRRVAMNYASLRGLVDR